MNRTIEQQSARRAGSTVRGLAFDANHGAGVRCLGSWPATKPMTATTYLRPRGMSRRT